MKSKVIIEKREELIKFVKQQMQGPNALCGRFGIDGWDKGEILDETPGSIYSTAIMFPARDSSAIHEDDNNNSSVVQNTAQVDNADEGETVESNIDADSQSASSNKVGSVDENDEDSRELCQRFPQSYGISFCLDEGVLNDNDLKIRVRARHYSKEWSPLKAYVNVDENDRAAVESLARNALLNNYFKYVSGRLYLKTDSTKDYPDLKKTLDVINKQEFQRLASWEVNYANREMYLASYKHHLYEDIYMSSSSKIDSGLRQQAHNCIKEVEKSERILSYFENILGIINPKGYGFWKAENLEHEIDLSSISLDMQDGEYRKMYTPLKCPSLKSIFERPFSSKLKGSKMDSGLASVSAWIQIVKDKRNLSNNKIYVKVLIQNTSDVMKEEKGNLYSIVNESVNIRSFFGVEIEAESSHIVPYQEISNYNPNDQELEQLNYVYRDVKSYGTGHVCSVEWNNLENGRMRVYSSFIPSQEVPDVDVIPKKYNSEKNEVEDWILDTKYLEFKTLSTLSDESDDDIRSGLKAFVDAYGNWIDTQQDDNTIADTIQKLCREDYERMLANINLLRASENIRAFRLMNTAMFLQLWHSRDENLENLRHDHTSCTPVRGRRTRTMQVNEDYYRKLSGAVVGKRMAAWRSFQLAFIILNLDGIIQDEANDSSWNKRNNQVDLVWFPTGGGKTEAYLGLIALSIIVRRFRAAAGLEYEGGTTAIMRYTLRLLATQQFQRAMRLILALGTIQKWQLGGLGTEPISIGLFVGEASLPNKTADLNKEAEQWKQDSPSKIPLDRHHCPWCGGELSYDSTSHLFNCTSGYCTFATGLPVYLCDEMIYQQPPTLLFGTVDKFAMIAHKVSDDSKKDSRRLLRDANNTPDLIIQDELHLLCGPLGSAVGLFECAIDQLATKEKKVGSKVIKVRPKVISSTATTRNTQMQIRALYGRDVNVFPKQGVKCHDSFFSSYKRDQANPENFTSKRKYVGILPTGRTSMYAQLRLASCVLAHRALYEYVHNSDFIGGDKDCYLAAADYYYTLITYFNSKKDVGTTDSQFSSEFPKYTRQIFNRVLRPNMLLNCHYTYNERFSSSELTGRLKGEEVVANLAEVQKTWRIEERDTYIDSAGNIVRGVRPPDVVLATNMISVGIDVSRFSVMLVNSMPKNKAEYIQATSRVARDESGVVFTIHNPFRARDVSHFEQFREFHEKLYYYVEPISITPFSRKSIETFMPLYLAAMIRHKCKNLALDGQAKDITLNDIKDIKDSTHEYFQRIAEDKQRFSDILDEEALKLIDDFVDCALTEWYNKKDDLQKFSTIEYDSKALFVPVDAYDDERFNTAWLVPTSVRFIPTESVLKVKE